MRIHQFSGTQEGYVARRVGRWGRGEAVPRFPVVERAAKVCLMGLKSCPGAVGIIKCRLLMALTADVICQRRCQGHFHGS